MSEMSGNSTGGVLFKCTVIIQLQLLNIQRQVQVYRI